MFYPPERQKKDARGRVGALGSVRVEERKKMGVNRPQLRKIHRRSRAVRSATGDQKRSGEEGGKEISKNDISRPQLQNLAWKNCY